MKLKKVYKSVVDKSVVAALLVMILLTSTAFAERDVSQTIFEANSLYENGDFETARQYYEDALSAGATNGHLYYNLANTYYRLENFGSAIANYRRAKVELPRNPDIQANLTLARKHAVDDLSSNEGMGLSPRLFLNNHFSTYEMRLIFTILYLSFWICVAGHVIKKSSLTSTLLGTTLTLTLLCSLFTFGTKEGRDGSPVFALTPSSREIRPAVITSSEAKVYSGNADTFQVVFLLHDGAEVEVRELRDSWVEIVLPKGRRGWVKTDGIDIL